MKNRTRFIYSCLISLWVCSGYGQDYLVYHAGINEAKRALIKENMDDAVGHYYSTFEKFKFAFARDCFNALEVALKIEDEEKIDYFLKRCMIQGVHFEFLDEHPLLSNYRTTDSWFSFLSTKDSLKNVYLESINWKLRDEIIALFTADQEIRDLTDKHRFNPFRIGKLKRQFEEIDRKLVRRLMEITDEDGFPGEKLIGIDHNSMHPKISNSRLSAGMPIVILIHHFSQPNIPFNEELLRAVKSGHLSPDHYAVIADFQHEYSGTKNQGSECYTMRFSPKLDISTIDKNRTAIGLLELSSLTELKQQKIITSFWTQLY